MYCSNCGKEAHEESNFCAFCGKPLASNAASSAATKDLELLQQYENHAKDVTCLECGHNGLKGMVKAIFPWYATFWFLGLPWAIATLGWSLEIFPWYAVTIVLVIAILIRASVGKRELYCPGCDQKIIA